MTAQLGCGRAGTLAVVRLTPLEGERTPPLSATLRPLSPEEAASLLGVAPAVVGLLPARLRIHNLSLEPLALSLPLELELLDARRDPVLVVVPVGEAADRVLALGLAARVADLPRGEELVRKLEAAHAPLLAEVAAGRAAEGLVLLAPAPGRQAIPEELEGSLLSLRVSPPGARLAPLVGGYLKAQ